MKALDRYLRNVRIAKARRFLNKGDVVVDVGCADGSMFEKWSETTAYGYGVDPILEKEVSRPGFVLYPGHFPDALPSIECDLITMLAVLEHIPPDRQATLQEACYEMLNPGGRVVITVPSPRVDAILGILSALKMVDGMSLEEHYGFDPEATRALFTEPRFKLVHASSFQFGLNNLFVFARQ